MSENHIVDIRRRIIALPPYPPYQTPDVEPEESVFSERWLPDPPSWEDTAEAVAEGPAQQFFVSTR